MRSFTLRVAEIATSAGQILVRCGGKADPASAPGQVYLARASLAAQPFLRLPLFPFHSRAAGGLEFLVEAAHPYAALAPGEVLDLLGPCGRGFSLTPRAAHLLLVAAAPDRLFGLMLVALERRLGVTFVIPADRPLPEVPPVVEVHRGPVSPDLAAWADVVALDVPDPASRAREIRALCPTRPEAFVQALLTPPMPCGTGACQACWVETDHGRRLACVDGPVFQW